MLVKIIQYLQGYLRIRVSGYSAERFLNLCSSKQIYLWGLIPWKHCYEMYISIKGFKKLKPILKKTGTKVSIVERFGLPFFLHKNRKRRIFFLGSGLCVLLIYILSLFIWDIHIEGNCKVTDESIIEFLSTTKVRHGMAKSIINCDRIAKDIRKQFDDIIWVSVSMKGTRLFIGVKENSDTIKPTVIDKEPTDIIASKSGTIIKMITRKGIPQVKQGDSVKKGDVLVTGSVEVLDDSGEVKNYQFQTSDADILAKTKIKYEEAITLTYNEKEYTGKHRNTLYLQIGNWYFSLGLQKNPYKRSEIYTATKQVRLGEHFYLPITYGIKSIREYKMKKKIYTIKDVQRLLSDQFFLYCETLESDGKEIVQRDVKIHLNKTTATAKGELKVIEDIGKHEAINIDFHKPSVIE